MTDADRLCAELDSLFQPRSLAIVGLPQGLKTGKLFLIALQDMGYHGPIYAVNPKAEEIDGIKCYPSVSAIPHPVDLAIVLVPHEYGLSVVRECAAKGVKGVVMFTAGYRETGPEGRAQEEEMVRIAREAGMRIFGPNCMGLYAPRSGLSFFPGLNPQPGGIGLISHSGSLANIIGRMADQVGLAFSKAASLGNEADVNSADFLTYLGRDEETRLIGAYLEGIKEGPRFLNALREAARQKPVILWKVGLTPEGGRAASSHTGALAGSAAVWRGVLNQGGAVAAAGWEEWVDALMAFYLLPPDLGPRMVIISGPGGLAVSAAEACGRNGLSLADLSPTTKTALAEFVPPTGTSLSNPIDVSLTASLDLEIYLGAARLAAADPGVDAVAVVGCGLSDEDNQRYTQGMIDIQKEHGKPFLMVNIPGFSPELGGTFCRAGVPFFQSSERAMKWYAAVRRDQARRLGRAS